MSNVIQVATTEKYLCLTSSNAWLTFSTASGTWKASLISFVATASFDDQNVSWKLFRVSLDSNVVRAGGVKMRLTAVLNTVEYRALSEDRYL